MTKQNRSSTDDSRKTFEQLARELECDEDEAAFERTVKRIAPKQVLDPEPKRDA